MTLTSRASRARGRGVDFERAAEPAERLGLRRIRPDAHPAVLEHGRVVDIHPSRSPRRDHLSSPTPSLPTPNSHQIHSKFSTSSFSTLDFQQSIIEFIPSAAVRCMRGCTRSRPARAGSRSPAVHGARARVTIDQFRHAWHSELVRDIACL